MLETETRNFEKWQEELAMERFKDVSLIIGSEINLCPKCGKPLSFANGYFFCRSCPFTAQSREELEYENFAYRRLAHKR